MVTPDRSPHPTLLKLDKLIGLEEDVMRGPSAGLFYSLLSSNLFLSGLGLRMTLLPFMNQPRRWPPWSRCRFGLSSEGCGLPKSVCLR